MKEAFTINPETVTKIIVNKDYKNRDCITVTTKHGDVFQFQGVGTLQVDNEHNMKYVDLYK